MFLFGSFLVGMLASEEIVIRILFCQNRDFLNVLAISLDSGIPHFAGLHRIFHVGDHSFELVSLESVESLGDGVAKGFDLLGMFGLSFLAIFVET